MTKQKNKWWIVLAVSVTAIGAYVYHRYETTRSERRIAAECQDKLIYELPMISVTSPYHSAIAGAAVEIRRDGQSFKNKLGFKKKILDGKLINFELYSINLERRVINKTDTIIVTAGPERYIIANFTSNTVLMDHGFLLCVESYEMNGRSFHSNKPNQIDLNGESKNIDK